MTPGQATGTHAGVATSRLLRAFAPRPHAFRQAHGATLTTAEGETFLDMGGASHGVALLGHNHPAVLDAIQAHRGPIHVAHTFHDETREGFLERLHGLLPPSLSHTFMQSSGAEAVECALKLAVASGRDRIVACQGSFHGRTTSALAATANPTYRGPFASLLPDVHFTPFNDVEALHDAITCDTAFIVEPIQGEGGVHPATPEFLRAARDLCTDRGAWMIADEIQTGGRTGPFLAQEHAGITADMTLTAKGLAGGLPIGLCSVTQAVADALPPGGHGTTYGGAPLVAAAGSAVLDHLPKAMETAAQDALLSDVRALANASIGDVRGRGHMFAIGLKVRAPPVLDRLSAAGILALPAGPRAIRFLPPLILSPDERRRFLEALSTCLP